MTERFHTDFLFADGGYLLGAGTVLNLGPQYFRYNQSADGATADARAILQDFAMIGQDIRDVAAGLEKEGEAQLQLAL